MPDKEWLEQLRRQADDQGGSGIVTTIDDYMRFARMLLSEGELDGARILQPSTVRLMSTDQLDPRIEDKDRAVAAEQRLGRLRLRLLRPHPPAADPAGEPRRGRRVLLGRLPLDAVLGRPANRMAVVFATQKIPFDGTLHRDIRAAIYGTDYNGF